MAALTPNEVLCNELEKRFEPDAMQKLAQELLGFEPEESPAKTSKALQARALVERCAQADMLEALADAMVLEKHELVDSLRVIYEGGSSDELPAGTAIAGYKLQRKLQDEGFGTMYLGQSAEGSVVTIKVLRDSKLRDRRGLQRFLVAQRALRRVRHPSVQKILGVGVLPDGRPYLVAEQVEGQTLAARLARSGAMHINEAKAIFDSIAEGLDLVHKTGLVHADLRSEHVLLVRRDGQLAGVLIDFGVDRLASGRAGQLDTASLFVLVGSAKALAPERARTGSAADVRSDVYAFGALVYETLTGKAAFSGTTAMDWIIANATVTPEAPSKVAPRGWINREIDTVVLRALAKDPAERYGSAGEFVQALGDAARGKRSGEIAKEEFETRRAALFESPEDDEKALALESAGGQGIPWVDVFTALKEASDKAKDDGAVKSLLFRAARVAQLELQDLGKAKLLYEQLAEMDPADALAKAKVREVRRAMATSEERAELLLEEAEAEELPEKRAELFHELAHLYERELKDRENALVAMTHGLAENPSSDELAREVERLAGDDPRHWNETLQTLSDAASSSKEPSTASRLLVLVGRWYNDKASRPDFAIACYTRALGLEAGNDAALEGAASVYRKAQQWPELVVVLLRRADAQALPGRARELRAEAADVLEAKLGDARRARELLEKVLAEDPTQGKAIAALERIYIAADEWNLVVALLERKAEVLHGTARAEVFAEIAETYEDRVRDDARAVEFFERARELDPKNMPALKGLERLYARQSEHEKLLRVLEAQAAAAATPRQKIEIWNRIGLMYEEEFVDYARAGEAFEEVTRLDPINESALTGLARVYRIMGRWDDLIAVLERHANGTVDPRRKAELMVIRGRTLLDPIGSLERASAAFEKALEIDPTHPAALEAAAKVRAMRGDVRAAAEALDALAAQAKTPGEKAEALFKAAKILEEKGDRDGAIERYKRAIDADDNFAPATSRLRELYAARGDATGAIEMLEREIEAADGVMARAKLWTQVARIYRDQVKDRSKAGDAAQKAVILDATNEEAAALLGEIKYAGGEYAEAVKLLAPRAARARDLPKDEAIALLLLHGDALAKSGDEEKALATFRTARELSPDDRRVVLSVADATFGVGRFEEAQKLYAELLTKWGHDLTREEHAGALYHQGLAAAKTGDGSTAVRCLAEATELDTENTRYLDALGDAYGQQGRWEEVAKLRKRRIELASDKERYELQLELGELLANKVGDKTRAAKAYLSALESRPDDRKLLMKLMQLYSEERDWGRLVEIILRLADLVDDRAQLALYYLTAAQVCHQQLNHGDEAIEYYELALENDPANARALEGLAEVRSVKKDWEGLEQSYRKVLGRLPENAPKSSAAKLHLLLGQLQSNHLGNVPEAIAALEKSLELDPSQDLSEALAELYLKDSKRFHEKAVRSQRGLLLKHPLRVESYKALRKLFTESKKVDEAWCLCQALTAQKAAEPEEENFFKRFRSDVPASASEKMGEELWGRYLNHPQQDPALTALFAAIVPAVVAARAEKLELYGLSPSDRIEPEQAQGQMPRTLHYAAGVLGLKVPPVFAKPSDESGVNFLLTDAPGFFLGKAALGGGPAQPIAFLAGNRMSYFRPGHFIRQVVPTGTGLRAWLFAAIRMANPAFPVNPELQGAVADNQAALRKHLTGSSIEILTSVVARLLNSSTALDLKRWTVGVDLTADRAGFLLANDLPKALAVIRATRDDASPIPQQDRIRELVVFATSDEYFHIRQRLGIAIRTVSA